MKFDDFENAFKKENKTLRILLIITIFFSFIVMALILTEKKVMFISSGEIFKEKPLLEDVCKESFLSVTQGTATDFLVEDEIINLLKKEPFELKAVELLKLTAFLNDRCRIIVRSEGKLRSFDVLMKAEKSYPLFYKLKELTEIEMKEEL